MTPVMHFGRAADIRPSLILFDVTLEGKTLTARAWVAVGTHRGKLKLMRQTKRGNASFFEVTEETALEVDIASGQGSLDGNNPKTFVTL